MKNFILLVCLCNTVVMPVYADWEHVNTKEKKATTPFGIQKILNEFEFLDVVRTLKEKAVSATLAGLKPMVLSSINVSTHTYRWVGPTKCQPDDPRLILTNQSMSYCLKVSSAINCFAGAVSMVSSFDPCE